MMNIVEARNLKVGNVLVHKFLKTEWIIIEAKPTKKNKGTFRHVLQQVGTVRKQRFNEKGLHLWSIR